MLSVALAARGLVGFDTMAKRRLPDPVLPFRWDLARREQLGTAVRAAGAGGSLWFADELVACAAKVLARCEDGELFFVGRSAESVFDLLSGAVHGTSWRQRLRLLPFSMRLVDGRAVRRPALQQIRANLESLGLAPARIARRRRKVVFVDLVHSGSTYENLVALLHDWAREDAVPWSLVRPRLRLLGITSRTKTSPKTWRWQQHAAWAELLAPRAIANVSLAPDVWSYFGNHQAKLTESFPYWRWEHPPSPAPRHDAKTLGALVEAVAIYDAGRRLAPALAKHVTREPAFAEPWLRSLALMLRRGRAGP